MTSSSSVPSSPQPVSPPPSAAEIRQWLVTRLSEIQKLEPAEIRLDQPLVGMGLDSMQFLVLVGELEQWLGCRFADNPLIGYPTINTLSEYLADQIARGNRVIRPAQT